MRWGKLAEARVFALQQILCGRTVRPQSASHRDGQRKPFRRVRFLDWLSYLDWPAGLHPSDHLPVDGSTSERARTDVGRHLRLSIIPTPAGDRRATILRFAADSALEGAGFELAVPRKTPGVVAGVRSLSLRLFLVAEIGRGGIRRSCDLGRANLTSSSYYTPFRASRRVAASPSGSRGLTQCGRYVWLQLENTGWCRRLQFLPQESF
jgi:hypothetical protein